MSFVHDLQKIVADRIANAEDGSYTSSLVKSGDLRVRQKVGEEAVETILACEIDREHVIAETADLIYHLVVLLETKKIRFEEIEEALQKRHEKEM